MTKRISKQLNSFKYKGEPIKITTGTFAMTSLCILLLIIATFTQLTVIHPSTFFHYIAFKLGEYASCPIIKTYKYIPQIPMIFFIVALLGRKFGILALCSYIILGMFFPIFALGGGISYFFEYGFGYILAFIPVVFLVGTLLKSNEKFYKVFLIALVGVLAIHILGTLYLLFIAILRHAPMDLVTSWINSQSSLQILYDVIFSLIALYLGRFVRRVLWIVMC